MPVATISTRDEPSAPVTDEAPHRPLIARIPSVEGRRVVVLAVHHVEVGGITYTGGAEKYIQTVIRALLDAGASVHVGYSGTSIYEHLLEAYHPKRLTVEQTGWLDASLAGDSRLCIGTVLDRRRWLRATRCDTVLAVQQAAGGAFVSSLLAARSLGLRVVGSIRQSPEPLPPERAARYFGVIPSLQLWRHRVIWRKRLPARLCHALIYNSHQVARMYETCYGFPSERSHVIHNGEVEDEGPRIGENRAAPTRIASVGRVTEAKGADVLLDAFSIVARRHPEARLTYFGDGDLIGRLSQRAAADGLGDRVSFAGYVPERRAIYGSMDICVQASRRESMSNSVVEAQARGIPCVVSDVGGMRETVADGESGLVFPREDATACADAICRLMADREQYRRFSRSAALRARREFNIRRLMRETVRVILGTD